jgi:hypothetical protein
MKHAVAWTLIAGLVTTAAPLHGQWVEGHVAVRSGPIAGHVVIRDGYSTYRRPVGRRVVVERPHVVIVERVHRHRSARHWSRRGYRPVTLYYWDGRYYDRWLGHRHGVRTIVVWERHGRYYRDCEDCGKRDGRHHRDCDDD